MCTRPQCLIIPPHILEALARRGNLACKRTLNDTFRIRQKRNSALDHLLFRKLVVGTGERSVYDCHNQYKQRLNLARREGGQEAQDPVVNAAYDSAGFVRDYFKETFQLNSLDNEGFSLISNVHYGHNYNNAYWDGDEMTYGDGDGVQFGNFANAIDVVAHELTHGLTQFHANLEYFGQSGALNEHFSDVFASIIKQKYLKQDVVEADWLIGDTVVSGQFPGQAIRSLKAPGTANEFDIQPAHMDGYYTGTADNQGVHINSGIPNKAFYLTATAIGLDHTALIWYHSLKALWRTASFQDMLEITLSNSRDLVASGMVPSGVTTLIRDSFSSVGLNSAEI